MLYNSCSFLKLFIGNIFGVIFCFTLNLGDENNDEFAKYDLQNISE